MFYDTVIQGAEILDRNDGKTYQVGIKDGRIAYIGQEPVQGSLVIDGRDHLLAPGLVNAHTHIAMTLFRSYADDMVLMDWLQDKIWPMENHLTGNDVYWGSLLGIAENDPYRYNGICRYVLLYGSHGPCRGFIGNPCCVIKGPYRVFRSRWQSPS